MSPCYRARVPGTLLHFFLLLSTLTQASTNSSPLLCFQTSPFFFLFSRPVSCHSFVAFVAMNSVLLSRLKPSHNQLPLYQAVYHSDIEWLLSVRISDSDFWLVVPLSLRIKVIAPVHVQYISKDKVVNPQQFSILKVVQPNLRTFLIIIHFNFYLTSYTFSIRSNLKDVLTLMKLHQFKSCHHESQPRPSRYRARSRIKPTLGHSLL